MSRRIYLLRYSSYCTRIRFANQKKWRHDNFTVSIYLIGGWLMGGEEGFKSNVGCRLVKKKKNSSLRAHTTTFLCFFFMFGGSIRADI